MTKAEVKRALGLQKDAELARVFGIGRWAVGQWNEHEPIPEVRQWQLSALRPDLFPSPQPPLAQAQDGQEPEAA